MRILQFNTVYKSGSTGKIVDCLGESLRSLGHEVLTCYGVGSDHNDEYSVKICSNIEHKFNAVLCRLTGIQFGGLFYSNIKLSKLIKTYNPDVVHIHCINGYVVNVFKLLKYLAMNEIKTVISLHAEIFHTAGCTHAYECVKWKESCYNCTSYKREASSFFFDRSKTAWARMNNAFNGFKPNNLIITAVSPWLANRAKNSAILGKYQVEYVPNGLDINVFYRRERLNIIDRASYRKVLLFVTPFFSESEQDLKGGRYIRNIALANSDCKVLIVASRTDANRRKMPSNVQIWGRAKSQDELAQLYSEADLTILLSRRETFSMVTVESLCCGTPIVGFEAGGPDSIAIKDFSKFVEYANVDELNKTITSFLKKEIDKSLISAIAVKEYSQDVMANGMFKNYKKLIYG